MQMINEGIFPQHAVEKTYFGKQWNQLKITIERVVILGKWLGLS